MKITGLKSKKTNRSFVGQGTRFRAALRSFVGQGTRFRATFRSFVGQGTRFRATPRSVAIVAAMILLLVSSVSMGAEVQRVGPGSFEGGIILGEPTGFSGKLWTGLNSAVDAGVAWSFGKGGHLHLHADYLVHNFGLFDVSTGQMPLYFGIGGRVRLEDKDSRAGLRIVIGTEYIFKDAPVSLFFEIAPIMDLIPETASSINGGFGARFLF